MQKYQKSLSDLAMQLDICCTDLENKLQLEKRIRNIKRQNEELSQSLSRLKFQIFEEKELNLRLRSEIGIAKLQEVADRKKIQMLLSLCNLDEDALELFIQKDWPHLVPSTSGSRIAGCDLETENEILNLKIKALKAELSERTELLLCERDSLIKDKLSLLRDAEARNSDENEAIHSLMDRLKNFQITLHHVFDTNSQNKFSNAPDSVQSDSAEKSKENVGSQTDLHRFPPVEEKLASYAKTTEPSRSVNIIKDLESQLNRSKEAQQRLKNRISLLQSEISKLSKPKAVTVNSDQKLVERVRVLAARNKELENRRKLENEGFRSDIKILRENLKDIEKQLLKIVLAFGDKKAINVDISSYEAFKTSLQGTDDLLIRLRDLQAKLS